MNNALFVVDKPIGISSNFFLRKIKRKYKEKKAGFSGTLDPFASGCLIVAFGQYTKLFQFLKKTPKTYRATLWLGAQSASLDNENMIDVQYPVEKIDIQKVEYILSKLLGDIEYYPPKYSAKKIDGKRAYTLARNGDDVAMKRSTMHLYNAEVLHYNHPFITIECTVSEGSYIRSLAQIIFEKLGVDGTLSGLRRLNEGNFFIEAEKQLDPMQYLDIAPIQYNGTKEWIAFGKKIDIHYLEPKVEGNYLIDYDDFFTIIEIKDQEVKYLLNKVLK